MTCSISVWLSARAAIRGLSIFPLKSAAPISRPFSLLLKTPAIVTGASLWAGPPTSRILLTVVPAS